MAKGYVRARYENVPGNETNTTTLATKTYYPPLITHEPALNPTPLERDDENRNLDQPLSVLEDRHAPSWSHEQRAYPDGMGFWLAGMLGAPITTAGNGVILDPDSVAIPAGATRHVWTAPFGPTSVAQPQTMQFDQAYVDQGTYFKMRGAAIDTMTISNPESGGSRIAVSGPAVYFDRQADPAVTPVFESLAIRPFSRRNLSLTWLTGTARTEDFTITGTSPLDLDAAGIGNASAYPQSIDKGEGVITWAGDMPKRVLDPDDFDALRAATGFTATAKWESQSIITGTYPYRLWFQFSNCQYVSGGPGALTNARRIGATFGWRATSAGSAAVTITLVNATAGYVTGTT